MDYDDLLGQWARLLAEFPDQKAAQGAMFRQILIDEMQDTNAVQVAVVEAIARAGQGNLTAVGDDAQSIYRFRGANYDNILKFPERHPGARVYRLEVNYRSTPEIVAFTNASIAHNASGFAKTLVSARPAGLRPVVVPAADAYEEAEYLCQQVLDCHEQGVRLDRMAVLYRNHHDSILLQNELVRRGINYQVRSGLRFFEQAHIKDVLAYLRMVVNPSDEPAWRRLLLLLPGIGPAKARRGHRAPRPGRRPHGRRWRRRGDDGAGPDQEQGVLRGVRRRPQEGPGREPGDADPAAAIAAILKGATRRSSASEYEHPESRLADIEQLGVLAARYDSLERLVAELLLAGDVYGMDTLSDGDEPGRDAGPEHDPPGQGAGVVAGVHPPTDRGGLPELPRPSTSPAARTRSGGSSTSPSPGRWTNSF